jgi:hypothetical protein
MKGIQSDWVVMTHGEMSATTRERHVLRSIPNDDNDPSSIAASYITKVKHVLSS